MNNKQVTLNDVKKNLEKAKDYLAYWDKKLDQLCKDIGIKRIK